VLVSTVVLRADSWLRAEQQRNQQQQQQQQEQQPDVICWLARPAAICVYTAGVQAYINACEHASSCALMMAQGCNCMAKQ
jgi:hypothetical protein